MKKADGFTIVELIIIILLLGIVASIAGPRFTNILTFSNRANKDKIQFVLKAAQKIAISQRRNVYVMVVNNELMGCYVNTSCPSDQKMTVNNKPYTVDLTGSNIVIPNFSFNSLGKTGLGKITINVGSKKLYVEEESGFVHE